MTAPGSRRPAGRDLRDRDAGRSLATCRPVGLAIALLSTGLAAVPVTGQTEPGQPGGRAVVEALQFPPLDFVQPSARREAIGGVDVLVLEDHTLPLVTVHAYFEGGYGRFGRDVYAAGMGLAALMRYGGTETRPPAAVDEEVEQLALQLSFGSAGGSVTSSVNALSQHTEAALELWGEMLTRPGFAPEEIAAWRARQLEGVLRRADDPARLAYSEVNRLLFGDHPVGWEMDANDLDPSRVTAERFRSVHQRVACRENLVLGATGDFEWSDMASLLVRLVERVPECREALPKEPAPVIRRAAGVFMIEKDIEQAVIVLAHPSSVHFGDDPEYFAATIGNSILGGGGFSSRLMERVRTDEGYAYSVSSLWTTPRTHEGLIGATTRTRPENAVAAIELILATMGELRTTAPAPEEVTTTVDQMVNGFVFNFDSASQIVARSMYYLAQDLPMDWLERYLHGIQLVTPEDVLRVFSEQLHPEEMTILIVGDPARMGPARLAALGPVTVLEAR